MHSFIANEHCHLAVFQQTKTGQARCGDAYTMIANEDYSLIALADGLGSGNEAHESAELVMKLIQRYPNKSVKELMEVCNSYLYGKRGVVVSILKLCAKTRKMDYGNVGNISFIYFLPSGQVIRPVPKRGFLSGRKLAVQYDTFTYEKNGMFLLHSDGIQLTGIRTEDVAAFFSCGLEDRFINQHVKVQDDDMTLIIGQLR